MFIMLVWFFFIQSEAWQKSNGSGPNPFFDWWRLRWIYKQWLRWSQSAWQFFFKCHDVKCTKFFLFIISVLFLITNLCFKRWFHIFMKLSFIKSRFFWIEFSVGCQSLLKHHKSCMHVAPIIWSKIGTKRKSSLLFFNSKILFFLSFSLFCSVFGFWVFFCVLGFFVGFFVGGGCCCLQAHACCFLVCLFVSNSF